MELETIFNARTGGRPRPFWAALGASVAFVACGSDLPIEGEDDSFESTSDALVVGTPIIIKNVATNLCLFTDGSSLYTNNLCDQYSALQHMRIDVTPAGDHRVRTLGFHGRSWMRVERSGGKLVDVRANQAIPEQHFNVRSVGPYVEFRSRNQVRCLTSQGWGRVHVAEMAACDGSPAQQWLTYSVPLQGYFPPGGAGAGKLVAGSSAYLPTRTLSTGMYRFQVVFTGGSGTLYVLPANGSPYAACQPSGVGTLSCTVSLYEQVSVNVKLQAGPAPVSYSYSWTKLTSP